MTFCMKAKLLDITFLFIVRIDSIERLENILSVIEYLNNLFDTNIILLEPDASNNQILKRLIPREVNYILYRG